MTLTNEIISRVLPVRDAPWSPERPAEFGKVEKLAASGTFADLLRRSYFWQKALTRFMRENRDWASDSLTGRSAGHESISFAVGFIELDMTMRSSAPLVEACNGTDYFFGALVLDSDAAEPLQQQIDAGQLDPAMAKIPVAYLNVSDEFDAPPALVNATAACWAAPVNLAVVQNVVTAKHAIAGLRRGQNVSFRNSRPGILVDFCPSSVDAALVESPLQPTYAPTPIVIDEEPVNGEDVEFTGDQSGTRSGKITKTWVFPDDLSEFDPQRVYTDFRGQPGDSGSLVRNAVTRDAVGIYIGKKRSRSTVFGQSQYLAQATHHLNINLFE